MFTAEVKSKENEDISILIGLDNYSAHFICECGDASELGVKDCQDAEVIFISHTHIDHFINFDSFIRHQIGIEKRVIVCGPRGIIDQVQAKLKAYTWNLIQAGAIVYEVREILSENEIRRGELSPPYWEFEELAKQKEEPIFTNERFTVRYEILDHKTPSIAYLFKEQDKLSINLSESTFIGGKWVRHLKEAFEQGNEQMQLEIDGEIYASKDLFHLLTVKPGDSLGVIMDHAAIPANHQKIKALFQDCNKVFIECFYKDEDQEAAIQNYHSYASASGKIMRACGVKEAIPVHFSRKYKEEAIAELKEEFLSAFIG